MYVAEGDQWLLIGYMGFFGGLILLGLVVSLGLWWKRHKTASREWVERNKGWWMG